MFNPQTHEEYDAIKGRDVYSADNEKIGTIDQVLHPANESTSKDQHFFLVKPGMVDKLSGQDEMYIPASVISMVSEDRVILETSTASIRDANWSKPRDMSMFRRR
jgi:rRNA processing protein Gar1